jgi:hypothetical protein
MAISKHYCATCDTHFGGPPNDVTPEEHADIEHNGSFFKGIVNGNYKDWQRKEQHRVDSLDIDKL